MTAQLSFELVQRQTAKKGLVIKGGKSSGAQVDLEMLLTKPLLHCPGGMFGIIVMLEDPATFHLQCPC
ncbi:unnamed protein product [Staurois parvus]|uniref:Uncharacterized protein n=1 Tax=Staurois parvus TaxID=386267 RepID=A0ABN9CPJ8_9NEOB|nr:unnamed protein product [Staurois parvus]